MKNKVPFPCFVYCPSINKIPEKCSTDFLEDLRKNETEAAAAVVFGRYSDNNKSVAQTARWTDADNLFKEKSTLKALTPFLNI
jgi:hypothetical protein